MPIALSQLPQHPIQRAMSKPLTAPKNDATACCRFVKPWCAARAGRGLATFACRMGCASCFPDLSSDLSAVGFFGFAGKAGVGSGASAAAPAGGSAAAGAFSEGGCVEPAAVGGGATAAA